MPLKYSGNIRELCYPFIYEESALCDYEILTDELCTLVGCAITELESDPFQQIHSKSNSFAREKHCTDRCVENKTKTLTLTTF